MIGPSKKELPLELLHNELISDSWKDLDPSKVWDTHVHLIGTGDSDDSGIFLNPDYQNPRHVSKFLSMKAYMKAGKVDPNEVDRSYVHQMALQLKDFPNGFKLMLLAFDGRYDDTGKADLNNTSFLTPNSYAQRIQEENSSIFEWITSIHPYRKDAVSCLEWSIENNAKAVKWLPQAMGMDPSSKKCDEFYKALARYEIPLLTHTGSEKAVECENGDYLGNPLLIRRALDHGVKVIAAHCSSDGKGKDLDNNGKIVPFYELFFRLLEETKDDKLLYGDISAVTLVNHSITCLKELLMRKDWHSQLLFGSDYPLVGILPINIDRKFSMLNMLNREDAKTIARVRKYNPLLANFLLMRNLNYDGYKFSSDVFETRRLYES